MCCFLRVIYLGIPFLLWGSVTASAAVLCVDDTPNSPVCAKGYSTTLAAAWNIAACGDTILVAPGDYNDSAGYIQPGQKDVYHTCTASAPLTIRAMTPAVQPWDPIGHGAGELHSTCKRASNGYDVVCDRSVVSRIRGFQMRDHKNANAYIVIEGFEIEPAGWGVGIELRNCAYCTVRRNFIHKATQACLALATLSDQNTNSDHATVEGNHFYRCGGLDNYNEVDGRWYASTGDSDINLQAGAADLHNNNLYGSGKPNEVERNDNGQRDLLATSSSGLEQGTCGLVIDATNIYSKRQVTCGTRFYRNRVFDHATNVHWSTHPVGQDTQGVEQYAYDQDVPPDHSSCFGDGYAVAVKYSKCSLENAVQIYDNQMVNNDGFHVEISHGTEGILFYNNIVSGSRFKQPPEEECAEYKNERTDNGQMGVYIWVHNSGQHGGQKEIWVFNNKIVENEGPGLGITTGGTCAPDGSYDSNGGNCPNQYIRVFNNTIAGNLVGMDLNGPAKDWIIANNVVAYNSEADLRLWNWLSKAGTFASNVIGTPPVDSAHQPVALQNYFNKRTGAGPNEGSWLGVDPHLTLRCNARKRRDYTLTSLSPGIENGSLWAELNLLRVLKYVPDHSEPFGFFGANRRKPGVGHSEIVGQCEGVQTAH